MRALEENYARNGFSPIFDRHLFVSTHGYGKDSIGRSIRR